ncbi:putative arylalkylamine n-acetyltransferase [Streptococcus sp. DD13]|nr:putative arylalkylamine n-acetyltransferase [Streptococcus sp. DD13]
MAAYLIAVPSDRDTVADAIFLDPASLHGQDRYLSIASLSVAEGFKGQGLATLLLAGLKEIAVAQSYQGIALTCHDYLLSFYERHGFEDRGLSASTFGGQEWYDMYWPAP